MVLGVYERPKGMQRPVTRTGSPSGRAPLLPLHFVAVIYSVSANTDSRTGALTQANEDPASGRTGAAVEG